MHYYQQLNLAENWCWVFGKAQEHHFTKQVDVLIQAYYDTRGRKKCADTPNIDDKIFTDILIRYKKQGRRKKQAVERRVWFIEDDSPEYLRRVVKESIPSDHYKVVITITEVK